MTIRSRNSPQPSAAVATAATRVVPAQADRAKHLKPELAQAFVRLQHQTGETDKEIAARWDTSREHVSRCHLEHQPNVPNAEHMVGMTDTEFETLIALVVVKRIARGISRGHSLERHEGPCRGDDDLGRVTSVHTKAAQLTLAYATDAADGRIDDPLAIELRANDLIADAREMKAAARRGRKP